MFNNLNVKGASSSLNFSTWNVKGLNEPVKRGKILSHLKSLSSDIMFLQETHLKRYAHVRLRCKWIGQIYHSNFSAKSRGTAILIRKGVPFKHNQTISDKEGRYVIVVGEVFSVPRTLVNVYGPNCDKPEFFKKLFDLIPDISDTNLIIGGDFNCVLDPYLDKSSSKIVSSNSSKFLNTYISNSNMFDVWRVLYPTNRDYSFHSQVHNVYSRIDYFILDGKLLPRSVRLNIIILLSPIIAQ